MSSVVDYRDQHSEPTTEPREVSVMRHLSYIYNPPM